MRRKGLIISIILISITAVTILFIFFEKKISHNTYKILVYPNTKWNCTVKTTNSVNSDFVFEGRGTIGEGLDTLLKSVDDTLYTKLVFDVADFHKLKEIEILIRYEANCLVYLNNQKFAVKEYDSFNMSEIINGFDTISDLRHRYRDAITFKKKVSGASLSEMLKEKNNTLIICFYNSRVSGKAVLPTIILRGLFENKESRQLIHKNGNILPVIYIDTNSDTIAKNKNIVANISIKGEKDSPDNFSGKIKIEYRGFTSLRFGKKSFNISTIDSSSKKKTKFSLLGMPLEQEWVLYASLFDKSLIRNRLIFDLSNKIGLYAPRTRFAELYVNNEYQGVYIFMEKVKQDASRVNISSLKSNDSVPPAVTGGYILQIDRSIDFRTSVPLPGDKWHKTAYEIIYPKQKKLHPQQLDYIRNYMDSFEKTLYYSKHIKNDTSYLKYINIQSFIDYLLLCELSKNIDALCLSTYLSKDRNGKLNMGPLWDFDLTFGLADYRQGYDFRGTVVTDNPYIPFWWTKLMQNDYFKKTLCERYLQLRIDVFSEENIHSIIDKYAEELTPSLERNFKKWKVNEGYLWPNYMNDITYSEQIQYLKFWTDNRLDWLDSYMTGLK